MVVEAKMETTSQPKKQRVTLAATAHVMVIAAAGTYLADSIREFAASFKAQATAAVTAQRLELEDHATTSIDHASVTLTNLHGFTAESRCFAPVVRHKISLAKVEGAIVCSGELKPRTTVTLAAPYSPGEVLALCGRDERFGRTVDWSQCTFTLEERAK